MSTQIRRFTSRTAALTYQTCHRKRFLANHYAEIGLVPESVDLNLLTGSAVHRSLQHLLEHCRIEHPTGDFEEACIDKAVEVGIDLFREEITNHSLNLYSTEFLNTTFVIAEHECSIEGLVRAFAIKRLPNLLEEYEVLEVEHEEVYEFSPLVTFLAKADGLFRRKVDNKLVVLSIKTASEYADVTLRNILHDMQGCSEWAAIQDRLDRMYQMFLICIGEPDAKYLKSMNPTMFEYFSNCYKESKKPEVYAVQYEHLITGKRRQDPPESGIYKRYNSLIHPYALAKMGIMFASGSAFGQKFSNPTEYKWKISKGRQPKGWEKINIWEDMGVKEWVNWLAEGKVQPEEGNFLEEIIRTSDLVIRTKEEIEEWNISTKWQEEEIVHKLEGLEEIAIEAKNSNNWLEYEEKLNQYFSKNTQNCHNYFGKDCQFNMVCHRNLTLDAMIESGALIPRSSHHNAERLYHIERNLVKDEQKS